MKRPKPQNIQTRKGPSYKTTQALEERIAAHLSSGHTGIEVNVKCSIIYGFVRQLRSSTTEDPDMLQNNTSSGGRFPASTSNVQVVYSTQQL
jgi:hypothetical protein